MKRKAFTIVELLVVIGVIVVLAGILLPSLVRARGQSMAVVCLSNLRQLGIAAQEYSLENDGLFPASSYFCQVSGSTYTFDWDFSYVNNLPVGPGLLWLGATSVQVQKCPSWDGKEFNNPGSAYSGYNYNASYIGGEPQLGLPGSGAGSIQCQPVKVASVLDAGRTALFGDAQNNASFANTYMRAPDPSPSEIKWLGSATSPGQSWAAANDPSGGAARRAGAQGFRHLGRTNAVFCDGHAESFSNVNPVPGTGGQLGFLSTDNSEYGGGAP